MPPDAIAVTTIYAIGATSHAEYAEGAMRLYDTVRR